MEAWLGSVQWLAWIWLTVVLAHGLWRSVARPDPDPVRSSGPQA